MQLPKNVRRARGKFRGAVTIRGRKHYSPSFPTVHEAEQWIRVFQHAAANKKHDDVLSLGAAQGLLWVDLRVRQVTQATWKFYKAHLRPVLNWFGESQLIHRITHKDIERYVSYRLQRGVSPATVVTKDLVALKRLLGVAAKDGIKFQDPFLKASLPRWKHGRFDYLTMDHIKELIAKMRSMRGNRMADIVTILAGTGLRRAELVRLTPKSVDWDKGIIEVSGKTGYRYLPIPESVIQSLGRILNKPTSIRSLERMFPLWQKKLGEPRLTPHVLRHSFATAMAPLVKTPFELQALLGHTKATQTARYYHVGDAGLREAMGRLTL